MKKTILITLCLTLLSACTSVAPVEPVDTETGPVEVTKADPYEGWETFEDPELGIRFRYPADISLTSSQESVIDIGTTRIIGFGDYTMQLISEDYGIGMQEGCCYYYSGTPFDLNRSNEEMKSDLEGSFQHVTNLKTISLGESNIRAIQFDRINSYTYYWTVPSILIPYEHETFTNIFISGPVTFKTEGVTDEELAEAEAFLQANPTGREDFENLWLTVDSLEFL